MLILISNRFKTFRLPTLPVVNLQRLWSHYSGTVNSRGLGIKHLRQGIVLEARLVYNCPVRFMELFASLTVLRVFEPDCIGKKSVYDILNK